jgi:predicted amidohydrolase
MDISEFFSTVPSDRQSLFTELHNTILTNDPNVKPVVKPMMGKEMILYEERGYMKYGLASAKKYMSLHCLPMYMNPALHVTYEKRFPAAKFQKGCINFTDAASMPIPIVTALITECSTINIADMLEKRKKK